MFPVLAMLFVEMAAVGDVYVVYGGIVGAVIGAVVSVISWRRTNRHLRLLHEIFVQSDADVDE